MNTEIITEKFTKGPWAVQPMHQILWVGTPKDGGQLDELILHINQDEGYADEKKERNIANAKLIAAAPEMYKVLDRFSKAVFPNLPDSGESLVKLYQELAKLAIKKATE